MELKEYQEKAMTTCMESSRNVPYMALNLAGEVGELMEKLVDAEQIVSDSRLQTFIEVAGELGMLAKLIRKGEVDYPMPIAPIRENLCVAREVGDILWQTFSLCSVIGWSADGICQMNLDKLQKRKANNCIEGNGDGCKIGEGRSND